MKHLEEITGRPKHRNTALIVGITNVLGLSATAVSAAYYDGELLAGGIVRPCTVAVFVAAAQLVRRALSDGRRYADEPTAFHASLIFWVLASSCAAGWGDAR